MHSGKLIELHEHLRAGLAMSDELELVTVAIHIAEAIDHLESRIEQSGLRIPPSDQ